MNSIIPIALVGILGICLQAFIFLDQPWRPVYHPQLQSVELPRPLLQLLSPKKNKSLTSLIKLAASKLEIGIRIFLFLTSQFLTSAI